MKRVDAVSEELGVKRVDSFSEGAWCENRRHLFRRSFMCRKANRKSQNLFPLYKKWQKISQYIQSLKVNGYTG